MTDPKRARLKIAIEGFDLEIDGPIDDVCDALATFTDKLVAAFQKAKEAAKQEMEETKP